MLRDSIGRPCASSGSAPLTTAGSAPCRKQTWSSGSRSKRSDPDASYNPPIKTRTWENQADDVMSDGATTEKFRSLAVYADIKLQEALEKCNEITPAHVREENAPDRFRSACCLQVQPLSLCLTPSTHQALCHVDKS